MLSDLRLKRLRSSALLDCLYLIIPTLAFEVAVWKTSRSGEAPNKLTSPDSYVAFLCAVQEQAIRPPPSRASPPVLTEGITACPIRRARPSPAAVCDPDGTRAPSCGFGPLSPSELHTYLCAVITESLVSVSQTLVSWLE